MLGCKQIEKYLIGTKTFNLDFIAPIPLFIALKCSTNYCDTKQKQSTARQKIFRKCASISISLIVVQPGKVKIYKSVIQFDCIFPVIVSNF